MSMGEPPEGAGRPLTAVQAWTRYDDDEQRLSAHVSERMLALASLRPGLRVLDIATGRGEPAIRAALRVAPGGSVVATDPSDEMLEFARARAIREAVTNVSFVVTDAETLAGIPEQAFDAALCRWGLMFFERPPEAIRAIRRKLKPASVLVSAVWSAPEHVPWWSMPREILARHASVAPVDPLKPGPFRYASRDVLRSDLQSCGFKLEVEEERYTSVMESSTAQGVVEWCLAFGMARALGDQQAAVRTAWARDVARHAERYREGDGMYRLGGLTRTVVARAA